MMKRIPVLNIVAVAAAITVAVSDPGRADSAAAFYEGKTVSVIVGTSPGGGYDGYSRLLARHIGRHIPGNPNVVVKNMPGAGGLVAANHLYTAAPKDGTVFGTFPRGITMTPLMDHDDAVEFEAPLFNWIGSLNKAVSVCVTWHESAVKKWEDLRGSQLVLGAAGGPRTGDYMFPAVLNKMLDAKLKVISGYPGSSELVLAIERGEVDGRCGWSWSSLKSRKADWVRDGKVNVLLQLALEKHPDLPNVPLVMDLAETDEQRGVLKLIFARQSMGRPFAAPPGVPEDRVRALRAAFEAAVKDPAFLADAKKSRLEINTMPGEAVNALLRSVYATPEEFVVKAREAVKG